MRAVLDTNVVASGIFFRGVPGRVLDAWADGRFELVLSPAIYEEYRRTCERLAQTRSGLRYEPILLALIGHGTLVADSQVAERITRDPADDKFLLCALPAGALVVSGDKDLIEVSPWRGVEVLTPRAFLDRLGL